MYRRLMLAMSWMLVTPAAAQEIELSTVRIPVPVEWDVWFHVISQDDSRECLELGYRGYALLINKCSSPVLIGYCRLTDATGVTADTLDCESLDFLMEPIEGRDVGQLTGGRQSRNSEQLQITTSGADMRAEFFIVYSAFCPNEGQFWQMRPRVKVLEGKAQVVGVESGRKVGLGCR